ARKSRPRMTPWPKTQVKTQARAPTELRPRRPETSSAAAIRRMVNSEERMAANDVAPGETEEANLVPMAAANDDAWEAEAINQTANGQTANGQTANGRTANGRTANGRTASRERWAAANDGAGEAEATAAMALAAAPGATGKTEAIKRTANRERLTALGRQGQAPKPVAPARRAAAGGGRSRRGGGARPPGAGGNAVGPGAAGGGGGRRDQAGRGSFFGADGASNRTMQSSTPFQEVRRGIVWVLGPDNKPQSRVVKLGITDGMATEVIESDLKEGDTIILAQNLPAEDRPQNNQQRPPAFRR